MSFLENNIDNCKTGFAGEGIVRDWFIKKKIPFMQIDIMFEYNEKWCLGEIKTQEKFRSPPFDGHGLPQWQIDRRMQFYRETGIEPFLIIYDLEDKCLYINSLKKLIETNYFKTKGKKPRTIFDLKYFKKIEL